MSLVRPLSLVVLVSLALAGSRGAAASDGDPPAGPAGDRAPGPNVVKVHQSDRGFQLRVDGTPMMVFGMNWDYLPIGDNYNYDFFGKPDDFIIEALDAEMTLLKEMHVNVIRQYLGIPPRWVQYIYEKYGIYTILNHPVARYGMTIDGAWVFPVDYSDPRLRALLKEQIVELVDQYKNTPGLLMWLLGNENNYGLVWKSTEIENLPKGQQDDARAVHLYSLFGELTDLIHQRDQNHPVAIANGDLGFLDVIKTECPNLDVLGTNVYRGPSSRDLFQRVRDELGLPLLYTEFGADAYDAKRGREDDVAQARVLQSLWQEIYEQSYGHGGAANAIGGLIFQWSDGWWKYKQEENLDVHDNTASWSNQAYMSDWVEGENNMNEEWFGIAAKARPDERGLYTVHPRTAYYMLKDAFTLDPYAPETSLATIRAHFGRLSPNQYVDKYQAEMAQAKLEWLEKIRVSELRFDFQGFSTGGEQTNEPPRNKNRFDHTESFYVGAEARPTSKIRGEVIVNILGNVAENPIDEIFYENRGTQEVIDSEGEVITVLDEPVAVYQATANWDSTYFALDYRFRVGHYHWGYEGDFFGLFPEAYYQREVDIYNANAPNGGIIEGKKWLSDFKLAIGPEVYWGANPTVIAKYFHAGDELSYSLMQQVDIAQGGGEDSTGTQASAAIPPPQTLKTTLYTGYKWRQFNFELGGILGGENFVGDSYQVAERTSGPGYLNSGYNVFEDEIQFADALGGSGKVTLSQAPFHWYLQGSYRGLVTDANVNQTTTITSWSLRESGQGNHWAVSTGAAYYMGDFMVGPNFLAQQPLVGPLSRDSGQPVSNGFFDPKTGIFFPAVPLRNQFDDPFWVRSNRETYGFELLLAFDPTPATYQWAWDTLDREDAGFAAALDMTYRILPTSQDGAVAYTEEGFPFAFNGAAPQKNLWDISLRTLSTFTPRWQITPSFTFAPTIRSANWIYVGEGQANGDSARSITRWGTFGKVSSGGLALDYFLRVDDWGPYDYYRDFNSTFPLQTMLDLSYGSSTPKWFVTPFARIGVRGKYRILDEFTVTRFQPDPLYPGREGLEWEVLTYVDIDINL